MRYHVTCPGAPSDEEWIVRSENGEALYRVDGRAWEGQRAFSVVDAAGAELAMGRIRSTWRRETCDLYRGGELAAHICTSILREIRCRPVGEVPGPDTLSLEGDFVEPHYRFVRCARTVALVSTVWDHDSPGFGIEIHQHEDPALIIAAALAIRCLCGEPVRLRLPVVARLARPAALRQAVG